MAERANKLTERKDPLKLKTLAAAYAETGALRTNQDACGSDGYASKPTSKVSCQNARSCGTFSNAQELRSQYRFAACLNRAFALVKPDRAAETQTPSIKNKKRAAIAGRP